MKSELVINLKRLLRENMGVPKFGELFSILKRKKALVAAFNKETSKSECEFRTPNRQSHPAYPLIIGQSYVMEIVEL